MENEKIYARLFLLAIMTLKNAVPNWKSQLHNQSIIALVDRFQLQDTEKVDAIVDTWLKQIHPDDFQQICTHIIQALQRHLLENEVRSTHHYHPIKHNRFQAELNRFFQLSIDLFCIAGFDGYFKWVSPASQAILSYREAELKTRPFLDFVHPEDRNVTLIAIAKLAQDEVVHNFENRYRTKDGTYKWLLWNGIAVLSENLIYCTARDITARKQAAIAIQKSELYLQAQQEIALRHQAEVKLRQQVRQEKLIGKMLDRIRQSLDLKTVLNTTVAEVKNFLKCDRVLIFRLTPQGGGNVIAESVETPWVKILDSYIYDPCFQHHYVEMYLGGKARSIDDIYQANLQPCYIELLKKFQVRASLVVPILQNQQIWGLLIAHQCSSPRVWQDRNKSLLQQLATQVAIAIQQSQLYQQTCYQAEREKVLNRVLQAIHSSLDLQAIFKAAVSEIGNLLQVDRVTIAEYQVPKAVWQIVAEYRLSEDLSATTGLEIPDDNNEIAARLKRRETVIVNNTITELQQSNDVNSSLAVLFPHSWLMVPLWVENENQVWGSLNLWHERNSHTWQESEIELAQIVANQLAIALNQSQLYQKLQKANQELERIATLDSLTGIANRRYFDSILNREWQRLQREKQPLSLIFCDVDYFKKYNDTYGHQSGDRCLRQVAQALKKAIKRPGDLVARYGGEEFVIILPNTPLEGAKAIGERLRQAIQALQMTHEASPISPYITLSLGLSSLIPQPETSANTLVENADRALYEAKKQGRDRLNWY